MVHVAKTSFSGDPNLGLYGLATDKFCLVGKHVSDYAVKQLEEVLKVPVHKVSIYGTSLVGVFIAATSDKILVPGIIFDRELEHLKKILKGIKIEVIDTEKTALGNNILTNDFHSILSADFTEEDITAIKKALGTKTKQMDFAETGHPGSLGVITNKGGVIGQTLSDSEVNMVEKFVGLDLGLGTVNLGNPFMRSGIIANSNGFVIGNLSTGVEINRVDESLGFL